MNILPDNVGARAEGKVGNFLKSEGKDIEGFGQDRLRGSDGSQAAELDIVTDKEIIEVKSNIDNAKTKFKLVNGDKTGQAGKLVNRNADDFVNPHGKKPILYVDKPLPRDANGNLFPSDQAYINALRAEGIEFANSLDELNALIN